MDQDRDFASSLNRRLKDMSRRELIAGISAVGAAAFLGLPDAVAQAAVNAPRLAPTPHGAQALASRAAAMAPAGSDLGAVEHVVFLMLENRSYDHYFGAYPRGKGFDDHPKHSLGAFAQDYPKGTDLSPRKKLLPFHLSFDAGEDCTHDLTHNWGPMHECWNHGKMDHFVRTHTSTAYEGVPDGAMTMGYYLRQDIPLHWALADHFTLCDHYHASILGPTHPNRLMSISGTIDPAGKQGGPITDTGIDPFLRWSCHWTTVQELLEDKGVSWKVYHPSSTDTTGRYSMLNQFPTWAAELYDPLANPEVMFLTDHVLPYFKAFEKKDSALHQKAFTPTFPNDFMGDLKSGSFPSVSWIIPPLGFDEHPSASPERGAWFIQEVIRQLSTHKDVWSKTVLFVMYDENDGWFDHLPPHTAPKGTPDEWLTAKSISAETNGIRGPLGLGVRVPMLVVSPFSRGGQVASERFDHTSQLQFLAERFGIEVPNVSKWRRNAVGDLTSTLFHHKHDSTVPALPATALGTATPTGECATEDSEFGGASPTVPAKQRMPTQHGTTVSANRYFKDASVPRERIPLRSGRNTATVKSAANALAEGRDVALPKGKRSR